MARRNLAIKPARVVEVWEDEIVEPEYVTPFAFKRLAETLECVAAELPKGGAALESYRHLGEARKTVALLHDLAERAERQLEALIAHAETLRTTCADRAAADDDVQVIRDAIERSYHTRPGAWNEALRVARDGGDIAPILTGGYYL